MSLGLTPTQADVFTTTSFCDGRVAADSIYGLLHRECFRLFPDEMFADLFADDGRHCVPPMIVAVVMVLQRIEGCSDREAVDRFTYDVRWKYAAGGLGFDYPGFVHTVLVDMRARLRVSERPDRIFEVVLDTAKAAGLVGRRRVLDSTCLYDAVATMDTVTLIRCAIRGLLVACDADLESVLRGLLARDDDYRKAGKPVCDYEDRQAREELIDALAKDARSLLAALDGRELPDAVAQAGALLATVVGQDLDEGQDGVFRIARRVAKDRVISTVDPDARHGHKTAARGFDGYKGHVAVDPDSELITATTVTAGNVGDAEAVDELLAEELPKPSAAGIEQPPLGERDPADSDQPDPADSDQRDPLDSDQPDPADSDEPDPLDGGEPDPPDSREPDPPDSGKPDPPDSGAPDPLDSGEHDPAAVDRERLAVYGDGAYGAGSVLATLEDADAEIMCKVQPPVAPGGRFAKDAFAIDLQAGTVTCPAGQIAMLRGLRDMRIARFGQACQGCPLAEQCTTSADGRTKSRLVRTNSNSLARASVKPTRRGRATTRPRVPKSNARSLT